MALKYLQTLMLNHALRSTPPHPINIINAGPSDASFHPRVHAQNRRAAHVHAGPLKQWHYLSLIWSSNWRSACARVCLQNQWPPNLLDLFMLILSETWWNSLNGALLGYVLQVFGSTSEEQQSSSSSHLAKHPSCDSETHHILTINFMPSIMYRSFLTGHIVWRRKSFNWGIFHISASLL